MPILLSLSYANPVHWLRISAIAPIVQSAADWLGTAWEGSRKSGHVGVRKTDAVATELRGHYSLPGDSKM
jgi:hypothetical protein